MTVQWQVTTRIVIRAGENDDVVLRGLFTFGGLTFTGDAGVLFMSGASLRIENSVIHENRYHGIEFAPSAGTPELFILNSVIATNGSDTSGGGIQIAPTGSAGARVHIDGTKVLDNLIGIRADARETTGTIDVAAPSAPTLVSESADQPSVIMAPASPPRMVMSSSRTATSCQL